VASYLTKLLFYVFALPVSVRFLAIEGFDGYHFARAFLRRHSPNLGSGQQMELPLSA
jgi:hypothetical protein